MPESIVLGPTLIAASMELRQGASIRPIESALADLAREVGVEAISVENDPARPFYIRFLIARQDREFPELPAEPAPIVEPAEQAYLGVFIGATTDGRPFLSWVSSWPHMLVSGTTGSGKTTFIRSLLGQAGRLAPPQLKVIVLNGKGEVDYFGSLGPEYFVPQFPDVLLGTERITEVLDWIVGEEIPRRRQRVLDIARENPGQRAKQARELYVESVLSPEPFPFPPLFVVIDEFAEIMLAGGSAAGAFESRVQQVTQVGRSVLVHLILATQRPDATVVRGAIKANLDARVALRLPTHHDSMTVLGGRGAEQLLGKGDLLFRSSAHPTVRLQGYSA